MRRLLPLVLLLATAQPAEAAAPSVSISASAILGQAPLMVTLTATGAADSYSWDLGDGTRAEGPVVHHTYPTGRYTVTLTASVAGESTQTRVTITAAKLVLAPPKVGTYGRRGRIEGRILPALHGARISLHSNGQVVETQSTGRGGRVSFQPRYGEPAGYQAFFGAITSNVVAPSIRPQIRLWFPRSRMVGRPLTLTAAVRPAAAGTLRVRIWRDGRRLRPRALGLRGRIRLATNRPAAYVVRVELTPAGAFARVTRTLRSTVHVPTLRRGARGPSVRLLETRLRELTYVLRGVDGLYATDTVEAVLAFQKVHGLARTGQVGPGLWSRLFRATRPWARHAGTHLEVSKGRQLLFDVRDGRVIRTVHVSTGATGNTPVGRWRIYRKVGGWDWVLWYPMYFLRGFAVHGYPSVPAYPASHGCVRVPMWIAPKLFADHPYGRTIHVY